MRARSAVIQGALAAAGLVAAYVTWQRPATETDVEVVVLDVSKGDIEKLRYEDARREVEVVNDEQGVWIRSKDKPPPPRPPPPVAPVTADGGSASDGGVPPAADGGPSPATAPAAVAVNGAADGGTAPATAPAAVAANAADGGAGPVAAPPLVAAGHPADAGASPPPAKTREFRANEAGEKLMDRFGPLRGVRALGVLPEDKQQELGLVDATRTIEVVTSRGAHRFKVASDPSGGSSPYLKSEEDGKVYLVKATVVSDLEFASSRLVDRALHDFRDDEWKSLTISAEGKTRTLVKVKNKLADSEGAAPDELVSNWHEKLWRMIGVDVLGRGEVPAAGEPEVKVRVEYRSGSKEVGFIELAQAGSDTFARTEHTAGWVRLHAGADALVRERQAVVGK